MKKKLTLMPGKGGGRERHGLYQDVALDQLDRRTQAGQLANETYSRILEQVGDGDVVVERLARQAAVLDVLVTRCGLALLADESIEVPGHFLPAQNSLRLLLKQISELGGERREVDLDTYLKSAYSTPQEE